MKMNRSMLLLAVLLLSIRLGVTAEAGPPSASSSEKTITKEKPAEKPPEIPEDRRWIIKQPSTGPKPPSPISAPPIKWKDKIQKARCEKEMTALRDLFVRTRYYSIQGDTCRTARYADQFLSAADGLAEIGCPQPYIEREGFSANVFRNIRVLSDLGWKRCAASPKNGEPGEAQDSEPKAGPQGTSPEPDKIPAPAQDE